MTVAGRSPPSRWSWSRALGACRIVSGPSMGPPWVPGMVARRSAADPATRGYAPGGRWLRWRQGWMTVWTSSDGGSDWQLELQRDDLLPGRLVPGRLRLTARKDVEGRGVVVTLRGEEHWKYEVTTSDGKTTTTKVHTGREDLPRLPVRVSGPLALARGETVDLPFELPAPPLGPPSVDAD